MTSYARQSKARVEELVHNIIDQDSKADPKQDRENHYFTYGAQDLFNTLNSTLDIIFSFGVRGKGLEKIAQMIVEILTDYTAREMQILSGGFFSFAIVTATAFFPDSSVRLQDR